MTINAATLATLFAGFNAALKSGFDMADTSYDRWAMSVPSKQAIERYPMALLLGSMRQCIGPRQIANLLAKYLEVTNLDYESSLGIPTNDIKDDNVGLYPSAFAQMGMDAKQNWPAIATAALTANGNWLDGSAFFGTSRTLGNSGTIANYVTTALAEATFNTAFQTMTSYKGTNGKPLGIRPRFLMVGPANRTVAHGIVNQGPGATAANANAGAVEVEVNPLLADGTCDNYWFLLGDRGVIKPVMIQKREEGPLVALDRPTDSTVFLGTTGGEDGNVPGGVNVYGIHYRGAAALSLPVLAYAGYKS